MKRKIALIAIACLMGLCACQNNKDSSSSQNSDTPSSVINVPVTGISLDSKTLEIDVGNTHQLNATITPENATNKTIVWRTSDEKVASVSDSGLVTGVNYGSTSIIAVTQDGSFLDTCAVTVKAKDNTVHVTGISVDYHVLEMKVGDSKTLKATISPKDATNQTVTWSTSNKDAVDVNNGVLTAKKVGNATITAKSQDGDFEDSCEVSVTGEVIKVTGISLDKQTLSMGIGNTATLVATIAPENASNKNVIWTSDKESVATVKNGVVTGVGAGSTQIKAKSEDGNFVATCLVSVSKITEYVKGHYQDEKSFINVVQTSEDGTYSVAKSGKDDAGYYYLFVKNSMAKISFKKVDNYKVDSVIIDDVDYPVNENLVSFMVGSSDFDIIVNYSDDIPLVGTTSFVIDTTAHIDVTLYGADKKTLVTSANPYQKIYIKCTPINSDYAVRSVEYAYTTSGDTNQRNSAYYDENSDMYYFTVPSTKDDKVKIIIDEKDMTLFRGSDFVGDYFILRTFNCTVGDKEFNDFYKYSNEYFELSIIESGDVYLNQKPTFNEIIQSYDEERECLVSDLLSSFPYKDGIGLFGYKSGDKFTTPFKETMDTYVAIKKNNPTDLPSDYSFHNQILSLGGTKYLLGQILFKGNLFKSFLINTSTCALETNVEFDVFYGNYINDDKSCYYIKVNGGIVMGVSYQREGGPKNRILLSGLAGYYTNGENEIVLPNENEIFYNGTEMIIKEIGNGQVTFYNSSMLYTVSLNQENSEFTVISSNAVNSQDIDFRGYTFTGAFNAEFDNQRTEMVLTFNDYETQISGNLKLGTYPAFNVKFTATYNKDTFMLIFTVTEKDVKHNDIPIGGTFGGLVMDKKILFKSSFNNSSNVFNFQNSTVTCNDFALDLGI